MKKIILSFGAALLFYSCTVVPISMTNTTYSDFKKHDRDTVVSYALPVIAPASQTAQTQTKGDVTVTAEVVPFTVNEAPNSSRELTYSDNGSFDMYEVKNAPAFTVTPENFKFTIRVRNNSAKVLRMSAIAVALVIDGNPISFDDADMRSWNNGMILSGFEQSYSFRGPQLAGLGSPKAVYLTLQDVPVSYNAASGVAKTEKFEWYFACSTTPVSKTGKVSYTYEQSPVYKERCSACSGIGYFEKTEQCTTCNGKGSYVSSIDGKTYTCYTCKGNKTVVNRYKCSTCFGLGEKSFPKSSKPPIAKQETWSGWQVRVNTVPQGAQVKVYWPKTGEYVALRSNTVVNWLSAESKEYPILLEYGGKSVKVLPYTKSGKKSPSIRVDFNGPEPVVKMGKKVE